MNTVTSWALEEDDRSDAGLAVSRDRYCIIGGGAAGLAVARSLDARGIPYDVLERHDNVGGIWDMANPGSPMYESAHFNTSKSVSGYSEFHFPHSAAEYPSHDEVLAFIRAYAKHYDLYRNIEFGADVVSLEPTDGRWLAKFKKGTPRMYRGVVLASGFQWVPNYPRYPGITGFAGRSFHSVEYDSPRVFEGQRVLVVGCGASGIDIANDAATRASRTFLSMRRGHYFLPKHIFGQPTDVWAKAPGLPLPSFVRQALLERLLHWLYGDLGRYGLPKPDHRILERPPILNSMIVDHLSHGRIRVKPDVQRIDRDQVHFVDGSCEAVDVIVYCTGYQECWPYLAEQHLCATGDDDLLLKVLHKRFDNLFVAGLLRSNAGGFWMFEDQGEFIARAIGCDADERTRLRRVMSSMRYGPRLGVRYRKNEYQSKYVDAEWYRAQLKSAQRRMGWC
jgi:hypothetical protein